MDVIKNRIINDNLHKKTIIKKEKNYVDIINDIIFWFNIIMRT